MSDILKCIDSILTIAQHEVYLKYVKKLEPFDLTPGQYAVLRCIWLREKQNTTPKDLADFLRIETPSVSGILDRLQNKDLIDRALDETNRRRIKVTTTKKSEAMKTSLLEAVEELNREISKGYTKKEWNTFLEMLYKIGNIDEK